MKLNRKSLLRTVRLLHRLRIIIDLVSVWSNLDLFRYFAFQIEEVDFDSFVDLAWGEQTIFLTHFFDLSQLLHSSDTIQSNFSGIFHHRFPVEKQVTAASKWTVGASDVEVNGLEVLEV